MPTIDGVMLPTNFLQSDNILAAPSGSLLWEFEGDLYLRGHRPNSAGASPIPIAVHLDSMKVHALSGDAEGDMREGVVLTDFEIEVAPVSALRREGTARAW